MYKELSEFKVKKNAIEAKVKEIGEKSREGKKLWVIKPEVKVSFNQYDRDGEILIYLALLQALYQV